MTSFWCFSIKGFRTWRVGAAVFFCMKRFYSIHRVLSVRGSKFEVGGWRLEVELYRPSEVARPPPTYNLQPATCNRAENQIGCGFAALCSLRLSLFGG